MKALCIIPARGGSKRIPRKNIRPLHGRPLLAWAVAAAREAGCFDEVMVSTDDAEVAALARDCGAAVPFPRLPATATDHATTTDVLREVLAGYASRGQGPFDLACCVYPTAALLQPEHLRTGHDLLLTDPALDSVMAVQAYHDAGQFYWFRPARLAATGKVLGDRCAPVVLESWEAVDLDEEADWQFLERLSVTPVAAGGAR